MNMTTMDQDKNQALFTALDSLFDVTSADRGVLAFTHCIYPSYIQVRIRVELLGSGLFLVTDDGQGLSEVLSMAPETQKPGYYIAEQARRYGLQYRRGAVVVEVDSLEKVSAAVMLVANASKDGVLRTSLMFEPRDGASFDYHFDRFVQEQYQGKFKAGVISGASGTQRKFRYIHQDGNLVDIRDKERIVLVEPVMPGQMSIAVKTQAHRDIVRRKLPDFWQCLVVDRETDKWTKSDIALLDQSELRWMDFAKLEAQLPQLMI